MDAAGFQELRNDPKSIIGASVLLQAPTGAYDSDRLINLGTNRWAVKPALGMIVPLRPTWLLEVEVGAWLFGDNDDFLGETREQDPIVSTEIHLIKRIRPGFWASFDANFYTGGETLIRIDCSNLVDRFFCERGFVVANVLGLGFYIGPTGVFWRRVVGIEIWSVRDADPEYYERVELPDPTFFLAGEDPARTRLKPRPRVFPGRKVAGAWRWRPATSPSKDF